MDGANQEGYEEDPQRQSCRPRSQTKHGLRASTSRSTGGAGGENSESHGGHSQHLVLMLEDFRSIYEHAM